MTLADEINTISGFVSHDKTQISSSTKPYDAIVLCVSAILNCASTLFTVLHSNPSLTSTLILCGGKGHSTPHLYTAIANSPQYSHLSNSIKNLSEAEVMEIILDKCFNGKELREKGLRVLVEGKSTNCGANAFETKKLVEEEGIKEGFKKVLVVQDPTMMLRTLMSFEKAFQGEGVVFEACPTFVPRVKEGGDGGVEFDEEVMEIQREELWDMDRFLGLIMGEVERLRDDETGYGPRGKRFIGHVDVPNEVDMAYSRLKDEVQGKR